MQIRTQGAGIQPPAGEFAPAVHQDRYEFVVAALEFGLRIHVDYLESEVQLAAQRLQGGEHVVAKMAVPPAVEDKSRALPPRISHPLTRPAR